jgi:hypothetical protein
MWPLSTKLRLRGHVFAWTTMAIRRPVADKYVTSDVWKAHIVAGCPGLIPHDVRRTAGSRLNPSQLVNWGNLTPS